MSNDKTNKDNSAQVTLYLLENGAIDCQVEWFFPHDTAASDVEIDTMITLIHGLLVSMRYSRWVKLLKQVYK